MFRSGQYFLEEHENLLILESIVLENNKMFLVYSHGRGGGGLSIPHHMNLWLAQVFHIPFIPVAIINDIPTQYPTISALNVPYPNIFSNILYPI